MEIDMKPINPQEDTCNHNTIKKDLGLSISPNLTGIIYTKQYINGEGSSRIEVKGPWLSKFKPPIQTGARVCERLSRRAKTRIYLACRIFRFYAFNSKKVCAMITLTFGKDFPHDRPSKKLLDNFLKSLQRLKNSGYFLWVAERQKRGAIHFHILTDHTDKVFVNITWNRIVNKWQNRNGFPYQRVLPNVKRVDSPERYLAKYITKGGQRIEGNIYGMSQPLSKLLKPVFETSIEVPYEYIPAVLEQALEWFSKERYVINIAGSPRAILAQDGIVELAGKIHSIIKNISYE